MYLELTDQQTDALTLELHNIIQNDRHALSPRIVVLREILKMLRAESELEPPPQRHYEPPSKGRYRRRG